MGKWIRCLIINFIILFWTIVAPTIMLKFNNSLFQAPLARLIVKFRRVSSFAQPCTKKLSSRSNGSCRWSGKLRRELAFNRCLIVLDCAWLCLIALDWTWLRLIALACTLKVPILLTVSLHRLLDFLSMSPSSVHFSSSFVLLRQDRGNRDAHHRRQRHPKKENRRLFQTAARFATL